MPSTNREYDRDDLLESLREAAAELGHPPSARDLNELDDYPSCSTYQDRFGSLRDALERVGLDGESEDSADERGEASIRTAVASDTDESDSSGGGGSVTGVVVPTTADHSLTDDADTDRAELLRRLRDAAAELGHAPSPGELDAMDEYPSAWAYYTEFYMWDEALAIAGIDVQQLESPQLTYTRQELVESLREAAEFLGHTPSLNEINELDGFPSGTTYENRFGSWTGALAAAGMEPRSPPRGYDREELLAILHATADELGHPPSWGEMKQRDETPCPETFASHFGTWRGALETAGFES